MQPLQLTNATSFEMLLIQLHLWIYFTFVGMVESMNRLKADWNVAAQIWYFDYSPHFTLLNFNLAMTGTDIKVSVKAFSRLESTINHISCADGVKRMNAKPNAQNSKILNKSSKNYVY